ncbi:copia-type polyprotein, partial [Trifolium medium]|nr:copia-type polyprotein [Trifolium medium]
EVEDGTSEESQPDDNIMNENEQVEDSDEANEDNEAGHELGPRIRRPPAWVQDFVTNLEDTENSQLHNLVIFNTQNDPTTYEEAAKHEVWRKAMDQEIMSIEKNDTWELTELPVGYKKIGVKWIYKTKFNEKGEVEKCKAKLVAKGYSQRHGVDYNDFCPSSKMGYYKNCVSSCSQQGLEYFST